MQVARDGGGDGAQGAWVGGLGCDGDPVAWLAAGLPSPTCWPVSSDANSDPTCDTLVRTRAVGCAYHQRERGRVGQRADGYIRV